MSMRFLGLGITIVAAASVVAVGAQHREAGHSAQVAESSHQIPFHHLCASPPSASGDAAAGHHASQLAAALGLSSEQLSTVERVTTEACAAMTKYHEQIMAVLTPEQRAKLHQLHGIGEPRNVPHAMPKRHGGR